jgi:hypothetical protein
MKTKFTVIQLLATALLSLGLSAPTLAASLSLSPSATTLTLGSSVDVDVLISDLGADEDLSTFDFQLHFDAGLLKFKSYSLGEQLGNLGAGEAFDFSLGLLQAADRVQLGLVSMLSDFAVQPGAFRLATLSFDTIGTGSGPLSLGQVTLGDAWGAPLSASLSGTSLQVSAVPEPASLLLLAAGLGLLAGLRRQRAGSN